MYTFEVHETIHRLVRLYYRLGIWQNEDESKFRKMGRDIFYLTYFVLQSLFYFMLAFIKDNTNTRIFMLEVGIGLGIIIVKVVYVLWKKEEILEFVYVRIIAHSTNYRQRWQEVTRKWNIFWKLVHIFIFELGSAMVFISVSCLPVFINEKKLPLYIDYSLDSEILYWVTYIFNALGFVFASIYLLVSVFVWYVMLSYSIEYQELGIRLKNLGKNEELQGKSQSAKRNSFARELVDLIKTHQNIYEYDFINFTTCEAQAPVI